MSEHITTERELIAALRHEGGRVHARGPIHRGWVFESAADRRVGETPEQSRICRRLEQIAGLPEHKDEYDELYRRYFELIEESGK